MRGSPRHSELHTVRLAAYALAGFFVGGALGYMFMGTAHAVSQPCQHALRASRPRSADLRGLLGQPVITASRHSAAGLCRC